MNDETTVRQLLNRALNSSLLTGDELQFLCGIGLKLRSESPLSIRLKPNSADWLVSLTLSGSEKAVDEECRSAIRLL